jgi:hypothetical protein
MNEHGVMRFGDIRPKRRASNEIGAKSVRLYYGHPWLAGKRLVRALCNAHSFVLKVRNMTLNPRIF